MNKQVVHILVGAVVVVAGVLFFLNTQRGGPSDAISGYEVTAQFGAVDGVTIGTKVLLTGIVVGEVTRLSYDIEGQRAMLGLTIRPDIKIPLDSVVLIVTDGLLGAKYLKVQAGGETEMMDGGGEFEYVQDSIIFEEILEKVILNAEQKQKRLKEKLEQEKKSDPNQAAIEGDRPLHTAPRARAASNGALSRR